LRKWHGAFAREPAPLILSMAAQAFGQEDEITAPVSTLVLERQPLKLVFAGAEH
jgi:hypothetical protein